MAAFNRPVPIFVFAAVVIFIGTLVALSFSRLLEGEGKTVIGIMIKSEDNEIDVRGLFSIVFMFLPFFLLARLSALTYQTSSSVKDVSFFVIFWQPFLFYIIFYWKVLMIWATGRTGKVQPGHLDFLLSGHGFYY